MPTCMSRGSDRRLTRKTSRAYPHHPRHNTTKRRTRRAAPAPARRRDGHRSEHRSRLSRDQIAVNIGRTSRPPRKPPRWLQLLLLTLELTQPPKHIPTRSSHEPQRPTRNTAVFCLFLNLTQISRLACACRIATGKPKPNCHNYACVEPKEPHRTIEGRDKRGLLRWRSTPNKRNHTHKQQIQGTLTGRPTSTQLRPLSVCDTCRKMDTQLS